MRLKKVLLLFPLFFLTGCSIKTCAFKDSVYYMEVSVANQELGLYKRDHLVKTYPIATSKFGLGDEEGSYKTPLGRFEVAKKIGTNLPSGAVFKCRRWTGEILAPNSPGRDPIVSRILWLDGLEEQNKNAFKRYIYIHGTAAECEVGATTSYGCVRMKSNDIIEIFNTIGDYTEIAIVECALWSGSKLSEEEIEVKPGEPEGEGEKPFVTEDAWKNYTSSEFSLKSRELNRIPPPPVPPSREGYEAAYFDIEPAELWLKVEETATQKVVPDSETIAQSN